MTEEIDNDVPLPAEAPKKASRARRKKMEFVSPVAKLAAALKFISVAQKKTGEPKQTYSFMEAHWIAASDGVMTVATKIDEDLECCPHTYALADALSKVGEQVSITQLSQSHLSVVSGAFKAVVPCVPPSSLFISPPDPACAVVDDRLKLALEAASTYVVDGAPVAMHAAVLLQANSCVGTNGAAMVEAWHGIDLPPGLLLPRVAARAVAGCGKALTGFGFSQSSATFYFEDESFIKTQLFMDRYPDISAIFDVELSPLPLPDEFFKALKTVDTFTKNNHVYFGNGAILTDMREYEATSFRLDALPDGMGFNSKLLSKAEPFAKQAQFGTNNVLFFGQLANGLPVRGAIAALLNLDRPQIEREP